MGEHLSDSAANFYFREMLRGSRAYSEQNAAQLAAFEAHLAHQRLAAEAGRRLAVQSLRMPTLEDLRTAYAERTCEGYTTNEAPPLSPPPTLETIVADLDWLGRSLADRGFLQSLGIKP